ncbi:hypothetical protein BH23ACT11_BH23ACT11_10340 [soil metagenome]
MHRIIHIMTPKTHSTYKALDMVPIPESILELGLEAGDLGVVDFVYDEGRGLQVEIGCEDGTTAGFVQLEAGEEVGDVGSSWSVVSYTRFES